MFCLIVSHPLHMCALLVYRVETLYWALVSFNLAKITVHIVISIAVLLDAYYALLTNVLYQTYCLHKKEKRNISFFTRNPTNVLRIYRDCHNKNSNATISKKNFFIKNHPITPKTTPSKFIYTK